ncbi:MAG: PH domain-containing protein [Thermoguttaceae bacterium]
MTIWPSIAAFPLGRRIGQLCGISVGAGKFLTLGKLFAVLTIPVTLVLFFWRLAPGVARRYVLTDRRVLVLQGLGAESVACSLDLAAFDSIEIEVLAGQAFLRAGDLRFLLAGREVLRLPGVQHPEGFRQACLRGQSALLAVSRTLAEQAQRTSPAGLVG